jgi:indole-3-glycerol phosphate synthase
MRPNRARKKVPEYAPKGKVGLAEILDRTRTGLPEVKARRDELERAVLSEQLAPPSFRTALDRPTVAVIAELKRRSPSAGSIREDLDPGERAALYAAHGAAAISVLTDGPFFGGSIEDLRTAARRCVLPILRKDFILDEVQILEARAAGAAAVLLIVRALGQIRLEQLLRYSAALDLDALVEVHSEPELDMALETGATIIGVNSRDLDTFAIDIPAAARLLGGIPSDRIAVAESGILGQGDVVAAAAAGADAVLIGSALSSSTDPAELLRELAGVRRHAR